MPYSAHGAFSVYQSGDLIMLSVRGGTNVELFAEIDEKLKAARSGLITGKWAMVTDLSGWKLAPPDFFKAAFDHDVESQASGVSPVDHIIIGREDFLRELFSSMKLKLGIDQGSDSPANALSTFHFCTERTEANRLLTSLGYSGQVPLADG
jgi:hypothetical protein